MTRRVLIFGGSFDPPHLAHSRLATLACSQLACDEVRFVPAAMSPQKTSLPTPAQHRLAMLLLTIADVPSATVSTYELDRPAPSYTIDTLQEFHRQVGEGDPTEFFLLMGADQALCFHQWKQWEDILRLASPAVMVRPPWTSHTFTAALRHQYASDEAAAWEAWTLRLPVLDISATEIRRRLAAGEPTTDLLHPAAEAYIRANGLYQIGRQAVRDAPN